MNLNHVALNSHPGETLGSSEAIRIKVTQNTNLPRVTTQSSVPFNITNIGVYLPHTSKKLKNNINKVVNTGYEMPLNKSYSAVVAKATWESTPKVIK